MGCGPSSAKTATSPGDAPKPAPKMVQRQPPGSSSDSASSSAASAGADRRSKAGGKSHKIHDDYEFLEVLGKGGFGEVRRAKRKSDGKMCVACLAGVGAQGAPARWHAARSALRRSAAAPAASNGGAAALGGR